jgi:hypothetical protein
VLPLRLLPAIMDLTGGESVDAAIEAFGFPASA